MYKCGRCGKLLELAPEEQIRCPFCGYKVLFRERPKVVRTVKAK